MTKKTKLLSTLIVFSFIILIFNINKPFIGHHDWNGAFWGNITRNYLAFFGERLGIENWQYKDHVNKENFVFFFHYTPFMPFLFTISSLVFGLSESSLRIVTVIFSSVMIAFIYKIGQYLYNKFTGVLAAIFTLITPMYLYFGKLPDHEPILTALCTITFYYYLKRQKNSYSNRLFYIFLTLSLLESWGGFFFLFFIVLHTFFFRSKKLKNLLPLVITGIAVIIFHLLLIYFVHGSDTIINFFRYGIFRMNKGIPKSGQVNFGLGEFLIKEARFTVIYFTRILTILSSVWLLRIIFKKKTRNRNNLLLIILFLYGFAFVFTFQNLAFIHDYKLYLLLPFIALSSASVINLIVKHISTIVKNKIFIFGLLSLFVIIIGLERQKFLTATLATSFNTPGYKLGKYIKENTNEKDSILVLSEEFDSFYGVFTRYYANRYIKVQDYTLKDIMKKHNNLKEYKFAVIIDDRPIDEMMKKYLYANFKRENQDIFTFVDLTDRIPTKVRSCGCGEK